MFTQLLLRFRYEFERQVGRDTRAPLVGPGRCRDEAAYRLGADQGMVQLEKQAQWLDTQHPDAAASLREGLAETFTVNRLGLPASLRRCLGTTNVIESPNSTVRQKIGRVKRWGDGPALDGLRVPGFGEILPPLDGLSTPLDARSLLERITGGQNDGPSQESWLT